MESGDPVMVAAASEQRKTTIAPIASGDVKASIGCFSESNLCASVATSSPDAAARSLSCCSTSGVPSRPGRVRTRAVTRTEFDVDDREVGDDAVDAPLPSVRGQGAALVTILGAPPRASRFVGVLHHHQHPLRPVHQVHRAAHALDHLERDHPVGQVSRWRHLHGAQHRHVDMPAADHGKGGGRIEVRRSGKDRHRLLAGVDEVRVDALLFGIGAHPRGCRSPTGGTRAYRGTKLGTRWAADPQVHVLPVAQLLATLVASSSWPRRSSAGDLPMSEGGGAGLDTVRRSIRFSTSGRGPPAGRRSPACGRGMGRSRPARPALDLGDGDPARRRAEGIEVLRDLLVHEVAVAIAHRAWTRAKSHDGPLEHVLRAVEGAYLLGLGRETDPSRAVVAPRAGRPGSRPAFPRPLPGCRTPGFPAPPARSRSASVPWGPAPPRARRREELPGELAFSPTYDERWFAESVRLGGNEDPQSPVVHTAVVAHRLVRPH
jgi:hypothetical protein